MKFQPPPTYALPTIDGKSKDEKIFNPIWINWFIELVRRLNLAPAGSGTSTGTNTGDDAANNNYINDYRVTNFVAGTAYLAPAGSAAALTGFPTFNQDTTGKAAKADALNSATTVINVSSAAAPSNGQVLTATSSTTATWQAGGGGGIAFAEGGNASSNYVYGQAIDGGTA